MSLTDGNIENDINNDYYELNRFFHRKRHRFLFLFFFSPRP